MPTETVDSRYTTLDCLTTPALVESLQRSQTQAGVATSAVTSQLAQCVDQARDRLIDSQGRLIFLGAGASGRIAVQDGAELWPTFGWPDERLLLLVAGGDAALTRSIEGAEDNTDDAAAGVVDANVGLDDVVLGLAASGATPWTCAWIEASAKRGALTIGISNNKPASLLEVAEHGIHLDGGSEALAGSTRLAAGTAQMIALNMFSTALMVKLNRTYGNLMVDMAASNAKLEKRRLVMLSEIVPDCREADARAALLETDGNVKTAALVLHGMNCRDASVLLGKVQGSLRDALQQLPSSD